MSSNDERVPYVSRTPTEPGVLIDEYMEFYGMGKEELARHLELDLAAADRLLAGDAPVTPEIAVALERLFKRPAYLWLGLEEQYQENKKRLETRGHKRPGAGRKPNPPRRYRISLPNALGRDLDARAKAAGMTSCRWIVNAVKRSLEAQ